MDSPHQTRLQGAKIIKALVQRETHRLRDEARKKGLDDNAVAGLLLLKALAGITGGIDRETLEKLQATPKPEVTLPALDITLTQSTLWDSDSRSIAALEPDLLAAELLQSELDKDHLQAGKWLFHAIVDDDKNTQQQALDRLIRLVFDDWTVLKNQPHTPPIDALNSYIKDHLQRCKALKALADMQTPTQVLLPLAITVTRQFLQAYEKGEDVGDIIADEAQQALLLSNLSARLAEAGDHAGAIAQMQRAIALIEAFATPGTVYADWHAQMEASLARLQSA